MQMRKNGTSPAQDNNMVTGMFLDQLLQEKNNQVQQQTDLYQQLLTNLFQSDTMK